MPELRARSFLRRALRGLFAPALRGGGLLLLPLLSFLCGALLLLLRIALRLLLLTALLLGLPLLLLLRFPRRAFLALLLVTRRALRLALLLALRFGRPLLLLLRRALLLSLRARGLFGLALLRSIDARRGILRGRGRRYGRLLSRRCGYHWRRRAATTEVRPHDPLLLRAVEACGVACCVRHASSWARRRSRCLLAVAGGRCAAAARAATASPDTTVAGGSPGRHTHDRVLYRPPADEDVAIHDGRGAIAVQWLNRRPALRPTDGDRPRGFMRVTYVLFAWYHG